MRRDMRWWMTSLLLAVWILGSGPWDGGPRAARADSSDVATESHERAEAGESDAAPYVLPPLRVVVFEHLHNKLVHFPIVLTLVATALLLLGRRRPELESIGFWLVWIAALSTLAAYFSGQAQEEAIEYGAREWLVEVHEKQGIALGIGQALWVLSLLRSGTRRWAWLLGLALSVLVGASGMMGGLIAHAK